MKQGTRSSSEVANTLFTSRLEEEKRSQRSRRFAQQHQEELCASLTRDERENLATYYRKLQTSKASPRACTLVIAVYGLSPEGALRGNR